MANHSMATKSKSNSHTAEMTEEVASKTEVADDSVAIGEIAEEAIKEEEASMAPEEILETDLEAASTVENKAT